MAPNRRKPRRKPRRGGYQTPKTPQELGKKLYDDNRIPQLTEAVRLAALCEQQPELKADCVSKACDIIRAVPRPSEAVLAQAHGLVVGVCGGHGNWKLWHAVQATNLWRIVVAREGSSRFDKAKATRKLGDAIGVVRTIYEEREWEIGEMMGDEDDDEEEDESEGEEDMMDLDEASDGEEDEESDEDDDRMELDLD